MIEVCNIPSPHGPGRLIAYIGDTPFPDPAATARAIRAMAAKNRARKAALASAGPKSQS